MKKLLTWIVIIVIVVAGIHWWLNRDNSTSYTAPAASATPAAPAQTLALNTLMDSKLGTILVATNGMTLYHFTKDTAGVSNCSGVCATNWPPYTVANTSSLHGGASVTGAISTLTRADGTKQLTYNGEPLYYWHADAKVGDTLGQGIMGIWFVTKP